MLCSSSVVLLELGRAVSRTQARKAGGKSRAPLARYSRTSAAPPASSGQAIDVPEYVTVPHVLALLAEVIAEPGAIRSGLYRPSDAGPC